MMGLKDRECGQIGVMVMAGTFGCTMDAPAAAAYAVLPVGVATIKPTKTRRVCSPPGFAGLSRPDFGDPANLTHKGVEPEGGRVVGSGLEHRSEFGCNSADTGSILSPLLLREMQNYRLVDHFNLGQPGPKNKDPRPQCHNSSGKNFWCEQKNRTALSNTRGMPLLSLTIPLNRGDVSVLDVQVYVRQVRRGTSVNDHFV